MTDHDDDTLRGLSRSQFPAPSEAARQRALAAAMLAFDAAEASKSKKSAAPAQGSGWGARLRSIVPNRSWIMDTRITLGLGTAAVALLLLPLGYQLYSSTAITPLEALRPQASAETRPEFATATESSSAVTLADDSLAEGEIMRQEATGLGAVATPDAEIAVAAPAEPAAVMANKSAAERLALGRTPVPPAPATPAGAMDFAEGLPAPEPQQVLPADGAGDQFTAFTESPVKIVAQEPVSTFSIDVDTASYSYVRQALTDGWLPNPDAVRIEEMINYFDYGYAGPETADVPFAASLEVYPTPWNPRTQLVQIGIKGYVPPAGEDKPSNLVFLLDTSGSMDAPDKLPLLKRAFGVLVNQLGANDTVSIVAYAGSAGVVLPPTAASDKPAILAALDRLSAGGSTAGAEGIELAYRLAERNRVADGINRVILATDGDFNVGIEDPEALKTYIKSKRDSGIFLSVLGFGQGNYGDDTAQALAQNGNGNASYIDSFREAQKVLGEEIGGTLQTIAKDVKIQVEFNPALVAEYRLVGYETRALNREDFNNDKVDAGEIGAGHTVTAIYEITPVGSGAELNDPLRYGTDTPTTAVLPADEIGFLRIRYKAPDRDQSQMIETPIAAGGAATLAEASEDARWASAVAAFAQKLKGSTYGEISYEAIREQAQAARGADENGYRAEFLQLVRLAQSLTPGEGFVCTAPEGNRNCR